MRVAYYTHPDLLAPALSLIRELSRRAECHLFVELSPWAWHSELFDLAPRPLQPGLMPARAVLGDDFPAGVRAYWQDVASFQFVVHDARKSLHPAAWRVNRRVTRLLRDLQPDVIHFDGMSRRMVLALPGLRRWPIVLTVHDPALHLGEHSVATEVFRRLMHAGTARFVLYNRTLKAAFCSKYRVSPERVHTTHLGPYDIFREWIARPTEPQSTTVLFFGRLSSYKGLEVLYRAAPRVAEHVPGVTFVVAGRAVAGYEPPAPPCLPNGGRLETHLGYVSNEQLAQLFQRAAVVVCPYVEATQSGVALTAYAFGRPVVASAVGGLPEYVRHRETGLLAAPGDADALAQALINVLTDQRLAAQLEQGVARMARGELSWRQTATEIAHVYARTAST